jgi:hypothetical protein
LAVIVSFPKDQRHLHPPVRAMAYSPIPIGEVVNDLTGDQTENSPAYDPALPVNRGYEVRSYDFYGRSCCGSR